MSYQPRPWNDWYRQYDKEGRAEALWAGVRNVVRSHRYRKVEDNDATANMVLFKFIVFAENHRKEIEDNLLSDGRLEGTIQTIARNELVTEHRKNRDDILAQVNTQENATDDQSGLRTDSVDIDRVAGCFDSNTPEQIMINREIDAEIEVNLNKELTVEQKYIFDRYWDFDGNGSDMDARSIAADLKISLATFHREVKRIKEKANRICLAARVNRRRHSI